MPLNRFITFVKPYINLLAAAISAWMIAKANVLDIPGLGEHGDELTTAIAAALTFIATELATQLADAKWLKGHHLMLAGEAEVQAATLQAPTAVLPYATGIDPEHEALMELDEDLVDDEEEFASQPDEPTIPVQPSQRPELGGPDPVMA